MNIESVKNFTIEDYIHGFQKKEFSPSEITRLFLDRIQDLDPALHAFLTIDEEGALKRAKDLEDKKFSDAELPPLYGIPIAIKDNICIHGLQTTCGSRILQNYVSPFDATVIEKLKKAGVIILGKTNMDEFAMGSSTENSGFRPTRNPLDPESTRRIQRRIGSLRRRFRSPSCSRLRYRRISPSTSCFLWYRGSSSHIRANLPIWSGQFCLFSRSNRAAYSKCVRYYYPLRNHERTG